MSQNYTVMNQSGMSLVAVLVSSAIALAIILGLSSFMVNMDKHNKDIRNKTEFVNLQQALIKTMSDQTICTKALKGIVLKTYGSGFGDTEISIKDPMLGTVKGKTSVNDVPLKSVRLSQFSLIDADRVAAKIILEADSDKVVAKLKEIPVAFKVTGSTIDVCDNKGSSDGLWKLNAANQNKIYFDTGWIVGQPGSNRARVGIGVDDPQYHLHVRSSLGLSSAPGMAGSNPSIHFINENAGTNRKMWKTVVADDGIFYSQAIDEAGAGGGKTFWMDRNGNGVSEFGIGNHKMNEQMAVVDFATSTNNYTPMAKGKDFGIVYPAANGSGFVIGPTGSTESGMRIDPSGKVGIGVKTPTYLLQLSTDSAAKPGTGSWTIASDRRLKDIHGSYNKGLDALLKLDPVYFSYKEKNPLGLPSDKEYVGIIAQNVKRAIPDAVSVDEKGFLHVNTDPVLWALVNAVKELKKENTLLKENQKMLKAVLCKKDPSLDFCDLR